MQSRHRSSHLSERSQSKGTPEVQWAPPRLLRYRPHVAWIYVGGQILGWLFLALGVLSAISYANAQNYFFAVLFGVAGLVLSAALYYFNQLVVRPYAAVGVQVVSDRLILDVGDQKSEKKIRVGPARGTKDAFDERPHNWMDYEAISKDATVLIALELLPKQPYEKQHVYNDTRE